MEDKEGISFISNEDSNNISVMVNGNLSGFLFNSGNFWYYMIPNFGAGVPIILSINDLFSITDKLIGLSKDFPLLPNELYKR